MTVEIQSGQIQSVTQCLKVAVQSIAISFYYEPDRINLQDGKEVIDTVPSSVPSIIDTLSGLNRNKDSLNTSLTCRKEILDLTWAWHDMIQIVKTVT